MRRLLVLLSVLVALAVCVPMVAIAQDATPEPEAVTLARTDTRYFVPFGPDGVNAGLTVTENVNGTCTAESLALTHRPDAWDCVDDSNQIHDPCFENPFAPEDAPGELACAAAPFSNEIVLLAVDDPLPRDKEGPTAEDIFGPWDLPWALELANGDRCNLDHSVNMVLASETVYYSCENDGLILGIVDRSHPVWTVNYLAAGTAGSTLVDVTAAWS
jgi:hypothetical protein